MPEARVSGAPVRVTQRPPDETATKPEIGLSIEPESGPDPANGAVHREDESAAEPPEPPAQPKARRRAPMPGEIAYSKASGKVALTFDAGASSASTPDLLATLRSSHLRVTFFLTGKWCEQNPDLVTQIAAEGHEIANHTYSHKDLRKLSDKAIALELSKLDSIVQRLTGKSTKPYFRPPYGARDRRVLSVAANEGYTSVFWSLDSWDAWKKGITGDEIKSRVLNRVQDGDIVLMHCGSRATADVLPELISQLRRRGKEIVTVSELLSD